MIKTPIVWKQWTLVCLGLGGALGATGCRSDVLLGNQASGGGSSVSGDSEANGGPGMGGSSGTGASSPIGSGGSGGDEGVPLVWDSAGVIVPSSNNVGINGPWYPFDDCKNAQSAQLPCTTWDPSMGVAPTPGFTTSDTKICAKGTLVKAYNFTLQWGAAIGLSLNSPTVDGGRMPYDAIANGVTGLRFLVTGTITGGTSTLQVGLATVENDLAGHDYEQAVPTAEGTWVSVRWTDPGLQQASYASQMITFDPTELLALDLQVTASGTAESEFDFCVSDLMALTN
jgi:hypothetical protein